MHKPLIGSISCAVVYDTQYHYTCAESKQLLKRKITLYVRSSMSVKLIMHFIMREFALYDNNTPILC